MGNETSDIAPNGASVGTDDINIEALYPLTSLQEGILFHTLASADPGVYVQQYTAEIDGSVQIDLFRQAWESVVARHAAMRSLVVWERRQTPLQLVRGTVDLEWHIQDLTAESPVEQSLSFERFLSEDRRRAFDLDVAPLLRFALFDLGDRYRFVWTHHHLLLDGWSLGIVLDDLRMAYSRLTSDREPDLGHGPSFQRVVNSLARRDRSAALVFWKRYLSGFDGPNELLGPELSRSSSATTQDETRVVLPADATTRIDQFVRNSGVTLNNLLGAAWALLVGFYSGDDDVIFGTVVNGRRPDVPQSLETVGLLMNTIPVRARLDPGQRGIDFIHSLQSQQGEASNHEWMPLGEIQALVGANAVRPLFDTIMVVENLGHTSRSDVFSARNEQYLQRSNFPLALLAFPGDSLTLRLLYDPTIYEGDIAQRILQQFLAILDSIVGDPQRRIGDIASLTELEQIEILVDWNRDDAEPPTTTVLESIRSVASSRPHSPAVSGGDVSLTYSELVDRSETLARALVDKGISSGDKVMVSADRSPASLVALLATQFAGAAYVPLDPALPDNRARMMAEETGAKFLITATIRTEPIDLPVETVELAPHGRLRTPFESSTRDLPKVGFDDVAYVIYTSGSTGRPKGVVVTHSNLAHSTKARNLVYGQSPEKYLVVSPFYFDSSVAGIYWTLISGGELVLPEPNTEQDIFGLTRLVKGRQVTHLLALPSVYRLMAESAPPGSLGSLRVCIVAGEPCEANTTAAHHETVPHAELWNEYGPTETTVWAAAHKVTGSERHRIPIGTAIPFVDLYVLNEKQLPVPSGATGELYVGGPLVSPGYLSDPTLTDAQFVTVDLPQAGERRLYRTGDLVRYIGPGMLDILGRSDDQIKIRGRRVEPVEVETAIRQHPKVGAAAVIVHEPRPGDHNLVGFYVAKDQSVPTPDELRRYLQDLLPGYLVPAELVLVDALPLTANGKIDRNRLVVDPERKPPKTIEQPTSSGEKIVLSLARDLIGDERISLSDNFFDAGGHSLLSMQLIARVFAETSVELSPNTLLFNTLGHVARKVDEGLGTPTTPKQVVPSTEPRDSDEPVRFGDAAGSLFGIVHRPRTAVASSRVVVLCAPYGWEYYKTHWAFRQTAKQLSGRGHTVLRFDYFGTGDSLGDPVQASVDRWVEDILAAKRLAGEMGESSAVTLIGLRLGGTLAAKAFDEGGGAGSLVLWDPVISGASHIEELKALHQKALPDDHRRDGVNAHNELLGSPYPDRIRSEIGNLDLRHHLNGRGAYLISSSASDDADRLAELPGVEAEVVADASGWNDIATFNSALLPRHIPSHVARLVGGMP